MSGQQGIGYANGANGTNGVNGANGVPPAEEQANANQAQTQSAADAEKQMQQWKQQGERAMEYKDQAMEYKDQAMEHKDQLEQAREIAGDVGFKTDWDGMKNMPGQVQNAVTGVKTGASTFANGIQNQNLSVEDVQMLEGPFKKVATKLPFKPTVFAVFLVLLGVGIYVLLLVTTAVELTDYQIVITLMYIAMSFMDILRERLVFLTDNNLVFEEVPGRQFMTQPRDLTLAWLWIPASWITGDFDTFLRVIAEMALAGGMLLFSQLDENSFKEHNNTGLEPEVLGTLVLLLGCVIVLPAVYLCLISSTQVLDVYPYPIGDREPKDFHPRFKNYSWLFVAFGLLKQVAEDPSKIENAFQTAKDMGEEQWNKVKDGNVGSLTLGQMKRMSNAGQEAYEMAQRATEGRAFNSKDHATYDASKAQVEGRNFGSDTGAGVSIAVAVSGRRFGDDSDDEVKEALQQDQADRIITHVVEEGFKAVNAGDAPYGWKQMVMPVVGFLAALCSALFYHGAETGYWVWENDGEEIDLNERFSKGGKILMVYAWNTLAQLAAAAFKDVDLELRVKSLMKENGVGFVSSEEHDKMKETPTGIQEGLVNAIKNPGLLCMSEYFPEQRTHKHDNMRGIRPHPKDENIVFVNRWTGLVWILAVLANVAKFAITARGAFFSYMTYDDDEDGRRNDAELEDGDEEQQLPFVHWYVWLEFGLITGFIWIFWFISTDVLIRNPRIRCDHVPGPVTDEPPPPPVQTRELPTRRPLPLYLPGGGGPGAGGGFVPLPGYINGGFLPRENNAPPPIYVNSPGLGFPGQGFPAPGFPTIQPMPGYRLG